MILELPELNETRCTGCGDCVAICPTACLEMIGPLPWLPRPRECIGCGVCSLVCPESAIRMTSDRKAD
jgi:formate hydrogenlyase subunit 6/NADH:ubiquinone oxidoreductase subunit I